MDVNTIEEIEMEIKPHELWLSAKPNICNYPMLADLKVEQSQNIPFY